MKITLNKSFIDNHMKNQEISSYGKLARKLDVSEATLYRIMNGERGVGQDVMAKMLQYFQEPFDTLFSLEPVLTEGNIDKKKLTQ